MVDGNRIKHSVSQLIDTFFPEFDSEYWSRMKAKERLDFLGKKYSKEQLDELQKKILNEWDIKREEAAKKGTLLHEVIEKYYNDIDIKEFPPEFKFFEEFIQHSFGRFSNLRLFVFASINFAIFHLEILSWFDLLFYIRKFRCHRPSKITVHIFRAQLFKKISS